MEEGFRKDWRGYLSETLLNRLTTGDWHELMEILSADTELDIQLRNKYLNVYYKGGNLLKIKSNGIEFDCHYFYNETMEGFDPEIPVSYIEKLSKGLPIVRKRRKVKVPPMAAAIKLKEELSLRRERLENLFREGQYKKYLRTAKDAMDSWRRHNRREERKDQHYISLANKDFSPDNNLVVIDIEFKLSLDSSRHPYNNTGKSCSFDIVAIDRTGQVYVIELKQSEGADREGAKANVDEHHSDFNNSVGKDVDGLFLSELNQLIRVKKKLGLLPQETSIKHVKPRFAIAYSGDNPGDFHARHPEILAVDVTNNKLIVEETDAKDI